MTQAQTDRPQGWGFKGLEFEVWEEGFAWVAVGPLGVKFKVIHWSGIYEANVDGFGKIDNRLPTYEAAVQAANDHCQKELEKWVRRESP